MKIYLIIEDINSETKFNVKSLPDLKLYIINMANSPFGFIIFLSLACLFF